MKQRNHLQQCPSKIAQKLQQTQRFNVTALMDAMSEVRSISFSRQVVSAAIIDDSGDEGEPGQLAFSFFMDLPLSKEETATLNILQEAQAAKVKPVFSFFALQGKTTDKGYSFEADSKKEFFLVRAVGSRATRLTQVAESLQGVPQASRDVLEQYAFQGRDYENELGAQTLCKLLSILLPPQTSRTSTKSLRSGQLAGLKLGGQWATTCLRKMAVSSFPDFTTRPQRSIGKRMDEREKRFVAFEVS